MYTTTILGQKRYIGREKALVIDTRDPGQSGRIIVNSRTLGKSNWIPYLMSPGFFTPPKVGDWVYVECEDGLEWAPVAHGKVTNLLVDLNADAGSIYREVPTVTAWTSNGTLQQNGQVQTSFGITGFKGHAILLDDGQEIFGVAPNNNQNAGIKIFSFGGNKIILSDDTTNQKILIADSLNTSTPLNFNGDTGNRILIDSETGTITISNNNTGTQITVTSGTINIVSSGSVNINSSGKTSITASEVDITSTGKTIVNANEADVTAPNVNVLASSAVNMTTPLLAVSGLISCSGIAAGGATPIANQAIINGPLMATGGVSDNLSSMESIRTIFNSHMHPVTSAPGETGTPTPPLMPV